MYRSEEIVWREGEINDDKKKKNCGVKGMYGRSL